MIMVTGSVITREGCLPEALELSQSHVRRSREEPGCISHAVYRDLENSQRLVFVEQWADKDALRVHFAVPSSRAFVDALTALAAEPPTLDLYEATVTAL